MIKFYALVKQDLAESYGNVDETRARLLTAQAAFETAEFTSDVYQNNKNAFGMRQPRVRETTSLGDKNEYASYGSVEDSVKDRLLWDDFNTVGYDGATVETFCQKLNKLSYFEAPYLQYKNGVNAYYKKLSAEISVG
jgi:hypothetical protein